MSVCVCFPPFWLSIHLLQWSGFGGCGGDNDGILHRIILLESLHELGNSGTLLSDSDVDAIELLLLIIALVPPILIDHGIESDGSLAGLTIANDQLTLTTANRHHGIDRLQAGLHWLVDRLAWKNAWRFPLGTELLLGVDWAFAVDRVAESVNDTTEESFADWNVDLTGVLAWCAAVTT